jgi:uncharacterized protein
MAGPEELFAAIEKGDARKLRRLLTSDPALAEARNDDGLSAVLFARYNFKLAGLKVILEADPQLSLFEAAAVGDTKRVAERLETNRALVEAYSADGFTALHLAAFFGHVDAAKMLLENDSSVDAVSANPMKVTPLHSAAAGDHMEVCRLLIEHGADVNARQQGGYTPLQAAAQNGNQQLVDLLLANGADPAVKTEDGKTASKLAAAAGHERLATTLEPE